MSRNYDYKWYEKQEKMQNQTRDMWAEHMKSERKKLRKKLTVRIGGKPRTHDMDNEMYETIDKMLESKDRTDIEIAREIVFDSNISERHKDKLVDKHMSTLLYGAGVIGWERTNISSSYVMTTDSAGMLTVTSTGGAINQASNNEE